MIDPTALISRAVTGVLRSLFQPTTISPMRSLRSLYDSAREQIAIISDAALISNPVSRTGPLSLPPPPVMIVRNARSSASVTRRHVTPDASNPSIEFLKTALSTIAASRLCADSMAWKSPVKWRLTSTAGSTVDFPPPVPPPLCPNTGPRDGCRIVKTGFLPIFARPCTRPTAVVDFPSPAGVGVIAVITINFALSSTLGNASSGTFALSCP